MGARIACDCGNDHAPSDRSHHGMQYGRELLENDLDNPYEASSNQDLLSPNIGLSGLNGSINLSWAQKYQFESATFDHYFVEVREVGNPTNARKVFEWTGATMTAAVGSPAVQIGASAGWSVYNADISDFAGLNVEVRFHVDSDTTINYARVAIDDFSVTSCDAGAAPMPVSAVSRKTHGTAGDLDIPLLPTPATECRMGGATNDYTVVVTFASPVTVSGSPQASVTTGTGTIGSGGMANGGMVNVAGSAVTIPLTNVADVQDLVITLSGVSDGMGTGNVTIPMAVLVGDSTNNRSVSGAEFPRSRRQEGRRAPSDRT